VQYIKVEPTDAYYEGRPAPAAGYSGLGAIPATSLLKSANGMITPLPSPIRAAIDASPLSAALKRDMKNSPLTFFIILAQFGKETLLEFIRRVQASPGARPSYVVGGTRVWIRASPSANQARLAAEFLAVCNRNPIVAPQIAAKMAIEKGVATALMPAAAIGKALSDTNKAAAAASVVVQNVVQSGQKQAQQAVNQAARAAETAVKTGTKAAQETAKQVSQTASKVVDDTKKSVESGIKTVASWFGFGEPFAVASLMTAASGTAMLGALSLPYLVGMTICAIALADILVPMLLRLSSGILPLPPNQAQVSASIKASETDASTAIDNINSDPAFSQVVALVDDRIFGLPRNVVIGGGVLLGLGVLALVAKRARRKR